MNEGAPASRLTLREGLVAALLIAAVILLRHWRHLALDAAPVGHDWYSLHQVDGTHIALAAREGSPLAFWSPWILGGTPLFAVPTKPFSYPPFLLGVLAFGPSVAMNLLLFLHLFVGGFGTLLLARRLGLTGVAPIACGIFFVLACYPGEGFTATPFSFGYAIAWWPFTVLLLLDVLDGRSGRRSAVWLGVVLAAQWHAGGEPSLYWLACFAAAFSLVHLARRRTWAEIRLLGTSAAVALLVFAGLAAVKLLPEWAWLESSGRAQPIGVEMARDSALEELHRELGLGSRLATLGTLLLRTYDGRGAVVLIVGLSCGLAMGWRRRSWYALFAGTAVCYVLASGALHEWAYELLPGYDRMRRHTRFVHAVGFGALLLAGYGFQFQLPRGSNARSTVVRVGLAALLVALVLLDTSSLPGVRHRAPELHSSAERRSLCRALYAPALADPRRSRIHHQEPREQPTWIELGLESTSGALGGPGSGNARYTELVPERASPQLLESTARGVLDVLNVRYVASYRPLSGSHLELAFRPSDLDAETAARLRNARVPPFHLYRRSSARERASLVSAPTLVFGEPDRRRDAMARILKSNAFDARSTVLIELAETRLEDLRIEFTDDCGSVLFAGCGAGDLEVTRWCDEVCAGRLDERPGAGTLWTRDVPSSATLVEPLEDARFAKTMHTIDVDVSGRSGAFLLLAEVLALHPGWSASVDGVPARLLVADGLATAVRLPSGSRHVRFEYRAPGFALGAGITAATLIALVLWGMVASRNRAS